MPVAYAVCPTCGHTVADPEHIRKGGVLVALALTCRLCGTTTLHSWPDHEEVSE